jgi:hypothetical protein
MHHPTLRRVVDALARLKGRYLEMPQTALTKERAGCLTGLDESTCLALLLALEAARFLLRSEAGQFLLRVDPTGVDGDQD